MRGNIRIRNKRWIVSAAALIALMAVANPEGMIIAVSSMLAAGIAGIFLPDMRQYLKPQNKKHDFLTLLIVALAGVSFYFMWQPSSLVTAIAQRIGMTKNAFLALLAMAGSCLACYSVRCVIGAVAAEKWRIKEGERKRVSLYDAGYKTGKKEYLFLFAIAAATITICSKSSPIYLFNDWVDSNCFFTVGKSMLHGKVLYRDVFEHKGFYLYVLHAVAYFISNTTFLGVYFFEIIAAFAFLAIAYRIACLFCSDSRIICVIPILASFVYGTQAFSHGDSAEEFCLPLLAYALYVGMKASRQNGYPNTKEYFLIGITSGCVLWIKYTMLGFYLGWFAVPAYMMLRERKNKMLMSSVAAIAAGVCVATIPVISYFMYHDALADLWEVYFYNNIFVYSGSAETLHSYGALGNIILGTYHAFQNNGALSISILLGIAWFGMMKERKVFSQLVCSILTTAMLVYVGNGQPKYYALVFAAFVPVVLPVFDGLMTCCSDRVLNLGRHILILGG